MNKREFITLSAARRQPHPEVPPSFLCPLYRAPLESCRIVSNA
jgi:hypothetical protein